MDSITAGDFTNKAASSIEAIRSADAAKRRELNATNSLFLGVLPPEIRNIIYTQVLISNTMIDPSDLKIQGLTSLLQVCAQIRQAATSLFFSGDLFHIDIDVSNVETSTSYQWLQSIDRRDARSIMNMFICLDASEVEDVIKALNGVWPSGSPDKLKGMCDLRWLRMVHTHPVMLLSTIQFCLKPLMERDNVTNSCANFVYRPE